MQHIVRSPDPAEPVEVPLKNPAVAAFLAWLWPGAGHLYQGRTGKGWLYMICILSTWFFGLWISGGHAVYASFMTSEDFRYSYICQLPVGIPAFPALVQNLLVSRGVEPLAGGIMAPPPRVDLEAPDLLAEWHREFGFYYELGTVYTMIAGLLNVLAIYDAYAGPFWQFPEAESVEGSPPEAGSPLQAAAEGAALAPPQASVPKDSSTKETGGDRRSSGGSRGKE